MSAHAKKRHTEIIICKNGKTESYRITKKDEGKVLNFLRKFKKIEEEIPWRKVAQNELSLHSEPGTVLKGYRLKEGLSQQTLAKKLKIEQSHISQMEHGKRTIGKAMAKKMATFFKVDYRVFL